jgi:hypothetical protein
MAKLCPEGLGKVAAVMGKAVNTHNYYHIILIGDFNVCGLALSNCYLYSRFKVEVIHVSVCFLGLS